MNDDRDQGSYLVDVVRLSLVVSSIEERSRRGGEIGVASSCDDYYILWWPRVDVRASSVAGIRSSQPVKLYLVASRVRLRTSTTRTMMSTPTS
jgi:hypothetical protein